MVISRDIHLLCKVLPPNNYLSAIQYLQLIVSICLVRSNLPSSAKRPLSTSYLSAFTCNKRKNLFHKIKADTVQSTHCYRKSSYIKASNDHDDVELCSSYERLTPIQTHDISSSSSSSINSDNQIAFTQRSCDSGTRASDDGSYPSFCTSSVCSSSYSSEDRNRSTSPEFFSIALDIDKLSKNFPLQTTRGIESQLELQSTPKEQEHAMTPCSQISSSFAHFGMN